MAICDSVVRYYELISNKKTVIKMKNNHKIQEIKLFKSLILLYYEHLKL